MRLIHAILHPRHGMTYAAKGLHVTTWCVCGRVWHHTLKAPRGG